MPFDSQHPKYLFQAAVGRSGSTILRRSIGLHPDVYYNGKENNLIQDVAGVARRNCTQPSRVVAMDVDQSTYDFAFRKLICDLVWPNDLQRRKPVHFAAINPDKEHLDYLSQVFPSFKLVCLVRNGIEVICSRQRYESFTQLEFQSHCHTWMRCEAMLDWGKHNPQRFFLFRHEWTYKPQLVEQKINELLHWAGLTLSPSVVNNIRSVNDCDPTSQTPKEFTAMSDSEKISYFRSKGDRWESWTNKQRHDFFSICGRLMNRLGYSIPFSDSVSERSAA